jgi:hypothetical protein
MQSNLGIARSLEVHVYKADKWSLGVNNNFSFIIISSHQEFDTYLILKIRAPRG